MPRIKVGSDILLTLPRISSLGKPKSLICFILITALFAQANFGNNFPCEINNLNQDLHLHRTRLPLLQALIKLGLNGSK